MNRRLFMFSLAAGVAAVALDPAFAQPQKSGIAGAGGFRPEPLTLFEKALLDRIRAKGQVHQNEAPPPADDNARGLRIEGGRAAILDLAVRERKYGVSLDGTDEVLIKNLTFNKRRAKDQFGSGLLLGQKTATRGQTWVSNAWIDLQEKGPNPDYSKANNEAMTVERGCGLLNVRQAVLVGGQESGLDNKGDVRMDAVFIASGHRPVRVWNKASLVIANSIVLAFPKFGGFWFGGDKGVARLDYYNCRFGRVGQDIDDLEDRIPDWMVSINDGADARITRLTRDPFERGPDSFWVPVKAPIPQGYLEGGW